MEKSAPKSGRHWHDPHPEKTSAGAILPDTLAKDLAALLSLPRGELTSLWQNLFGSRPPLHLSRGLMVRAIAFRLQEQVFSGLKRSTRCKLMQKTNKATHGNARPTPPVSIKPGTRLLREWQGVIHEVIILEEGVKYAGEVWRSLSAVAREITGTRWSGPLFFGLKENCRERD